ncbi:ataxin-3-like isoform X2 [Convolutriloba macropyga]|uniref:ataxin-3-like isoform X2 n=1 Tax=Convolutriloba macropyga TaxID=536237 RepID=UPI003F51F276
MDSIFFEKQQGNLCAQHCLNALLQGDYFSAVDLADIARDLDQLERDNLQEAGVEESSFSAGEEEEGGPNGSHHYDDSGYFSVQVIEKALQLWSIRLELAGSAAAPMVLENPCAEIAFICNFNNHWLTIRKLGRQWFNLNSMQRGPKFISDTYLSLFLAQLKAEGYYIFVVRGELPESEADQMLTLIPYDPSTEKDTLLPRAGNETKRSTDIDDKAKGHHWGKPAGTVQTTSNSTAASRGLTPQSPSDADAIRDKRLKYFQEKGSEGACSAAIISTEDLVSNANEPVGDGGQRSHEDAFDEDPELAEAIRLSLLQN